MKRHIFTLGIIFGCLVHQSLDAIIVHLAHGQQMTLDNAAFKKLVHSSKLVDAQKDTSELHIPELTKEEMKTLVKNIDLTAFAFDLPKAREAALNLWYITSYRNNKLDELYRVLKAGKVLAIEYIATRATEDLGSIASASPAQENFLRNLIQLDPNLLKNCYFNAVRLNNKPLVLKLLDLGIQHDRMTEFMGTTALSLAAREGHKDLVEALLQRGGAYDQGDLFHGTALSEACREGHKEIAKLLLNAGALVDGLKDAFSSPLICACEKGHSETATLLLDHGATRDMIKNYKTTPLLAACRKGDKALVELLITRGCSVDYSNRENTTPLMVATESGHEEIVKILLDNGAAVDTKDSLGHTALSIAIFRKSSRIAKLLLENGADVNTQDNFGDTPLIKATLQSYTEGIQLLTRYHACTTLRNNRGVRAQDYDTSRRSNASEAFQKMNNPQAIAMIKKVLIAGAVLFVGSLLYRWHAKRNTAAHSNEEDTTTVS